MDPQSVEPQTAKKGPSKRMVNVLSVLTGLATFVVEVAWVIYAELPIFAIPFVICVPVIAAVAFRNCWD